MNLNLQDQIKAALQQAALEITEQLGAQRLISQLQEYPARIRAEQERVAEARRDLEEAKNELEQIRAVTVAVVSTEINGSGKPRFSNEKAREAEVTRRLAENPQAKEIRDKLRAAQEAYDAAVFDAQRLDKEFTAASKAADLVAAQLHLLAGSVRM